jgi:membrane protein DedA with SNARE-associated domain
MPYRRFLVWDLLGIGIWLTVLTILGVVFAESVAALLSSYLRVATIGLWVVLTGVVAFIIFKLVVWLRRREDV